MTKRRAEPSQEGLLFTPRIDLCVDFANTLAPRGGDAVDSLHNLRAVLDWCSSNLGMTAGVAAKTGVTAKAGAAAKAEAEARAGAPATSGATAKIRTFADLRAALEESVRAHPGADQALLSETIAMRESIYRILHALASAGDPPVDDLAAFNRALAASPQAKSVERTKNGFGWRIETAGPTIATLLAPILWSAGALLTGPQLAQIRECANDECLWLFVDDSRNRTRRWCSMQSCGNRAKARRHYLRHAD
jgi:predicted RNA-binding Zn ribbon-like protein